MIPLPEIRRRLGAAALTVAGLAAAAHAQTAANLRPASASVTEPQPAGEWHNYAADSRSSKYSPLDQIDRDNVHRLEVAWRWKSIDYGIAARHQGVIPPFVFQNTPMMRDGRVLVATGLGAAALDPASGEILWTYDPFEDEEPRNMGRGAVRGGVTWNDGEKRRLFFTGNGRLTALDADTGALDPDFGDGGRADMLHVGSGVTRRQYFWTSAPVVCGDVIVVGESTADAWSRRRNPPGMIRGYDSRSGTLRWRFNIIPEPGEFGSGRATTPRLPISTSRRSASRAAFPPWSRRPWSSWPTARTPWSSNPKARAAASSGPTTREPARSSGKPSCRPASAARP